MPLLQFTAGEYLEVLREQLTLQLGRDDAVQGAGFSSLSICGQSGDSGDSAMNVMDRMEQQVQAIVSQAVQQHLSYRAGTPLFMPEDSEDVTAATEEQLTELAAAIEETESTERWVEVLENNLRTVKNVFSQLRLKAIEDDGLLKQRWVPDDHKSLVSPPSSVKSFRKRLPSSTNLVIFDSSRLLPYNLTPGKGGIMFELPNRVPSGSPFEALEVVREDGVRKIRYLGTYQQRLLNGYPLTYAEWLDIPETERLAFVKRQAAKASTEGNNSIEALLPEFDSGEREIPCNLLICLGYSESAFTAIKTAAGIQDSLLPPTAASCPTSGLVDKLAITTRPPPPSPSRKALAPVLLQN